MGFGKSCPDRRCRDCDLDDGAEQHLPGVVSLEQRGPLGPGTVHHDDAGEPGEELRLVPSGYFPVLVRTENEVERGVGVQGFESSKSVNRV